VATTLEAKVDKGRRQAAELYPSGPKLVQFFAKYFRAVKETFQTVKFKLYVQKKPYLSSALACLGVFV